jgi:C4-type Zn-finger protein
MAMKRDCPKCGRRLVASGEIEFDGVVYSVFQCDECLMRTDFGGEKFETALTFAVAPNGDIVSASDLTQKIDFSLDE